MADRSDGRAGFTVLESLAAMVVFAALFVAFSSLTMSTMWANHEARRITAATNLARDKIEELRATSFATIASSADGSKLNEMGKTTGSGAIYTRSWTVADGPVAGTKEVTVKVQWTDGSTHEIRVKTLIGN